MKARNQNPRVKRRSRYSPLVSEGPQIEKPAQSVTEHPRRIRRHKVWEHYNGCCFGCGLRLDLYVGWQEHHVMPRQEGGTNELDNLLPLCDRCHTLAEDAQPIPKTTQGLRLFLVGQLQETARLEEETDIICPNWEWRYWVYGGSKSPWLDPKIIEHRLHCAPCFYISSSGRILNKKLRSGSSRQGVSSR